jgi:hypothetical protein
MIKLLMCMLVLTFPLIAFAADSTSISPVTGTTSPPHSYLLGTGIIQVNYGHGNSNWYNLAVSSSTSKVSVYFNPATPRIDCNFSYYPIITYGATNALVNPSSIVYMVGFRANLCFISTFNYGYHWYQFTILGMSNRLEYGDTPLVVNFTITCVHCPSSGTCPDIIFPQPIGDNGTPLACPTS